MIIRTDGSVNEVLASISTSGGVTTVTGHNSAAYLGTDTVTGVEGLMFTPESGLKIDLRNIDANSTTGTNDAFAFVGSAAFTSVAGQLRAYQSGAIWTVEGDSNGDGSADFAIDLTTDHALTSADFFL